MAGSKGSKYYDVFLKYKVWLSSDEDDGILGDGKIELLRQIEKLGSLRAAADKVGLSYRKAWGDIKEAEEFLGFHIVEKHRGGQDGGSTKLTPDGIDLVGGFEELHAEFDLAIKNITKKFFHKLNKSDN